MVKSVLLLGRKGVVIKAAQSKLEVLNLHIYGGTQLEDVRSVFASHETDHVFMGAGIDIDARLEIIREIFKSSNTTTVHLRDATSGPTGFLPFVRAVLEGIIAAEAS